MRTLIAAFLVAASADLATAQQFFRASDGTVDFSKSAFADSTDAENQDMITDSVAITRDDLFGIYNPITESAYAPFSSPAGTLWFFGGTVQDVIDGVVTLPQFRSWQGAADGAPPATVGVNGVMYLQDDDAFVDITFTQWGMGSAGGGAFAYTRAVVNLIPEPATGLLLGVAAIAAPNRRRRG